MQISAGQAWNSKAAHSYKLPEDGMQHTSSCFLLRISLMRWAPILHWVLLQHTEHQVSCGRCQPGSNDMPDPRASHHLLALNRLNMITTVCCSGRAEQGTASPSVPKLAEVAGFGGYIVLPQCHPLMAH